MLAHYLAANVGFKVALHIFQKAVWWPLIFHPKPYYLQSGPYKGPSINDVTLERGEGGCPKHDVVREVAWI